MPTHVLRRAGHAHDERPPLELVRVLARSVRGLKVQWSSLTEQGLGTECFAPDTSCSWALHQMAIPMPSAL